MARSRPSSDGSYSFNGLSAGTYQIQILPLVRRDVDILSPGSAGGTAGNDEIQVTLAAGQNATDYNFAILGPDGSRFPADVHGLRRPRPGRRGSTSSASSDSTDGDTPALTMAPLASASPAVPPSYSISADESLINAGEATSTGFTFTDATTGTTYNYTVTSNGNDASGSVTGSGSVTSATQDVTRHRRLLPARRHPDLQCHLDRFVRQHRRGGHGHGHARDHAPSGYTIRPTSRRSTPPTATRRRLHLQRAPRPDATYNYTITSSSGGALGHRQRQRELRPLRTSPASTSPRCPTDLDLQRHLDRRGGQPGTAATATGQLDRVAPTGYTITADQPSLDIAPTTLRPASPLPEPTTGTTYNYTITSSGGATRR